MLNRTRPPELAVLERAKSMYRPRGRALASNRRYEVRNTADFTPHPGWVYDNSTA